MLNEYKDSRRRSNVDPYILLGTNFIIQQSEVAARRRRTIGDYGSLGSGILRNTMLMAFKMLDKPFLCYLCIRRSKNSFDIRKLDTLFHCLSLTLPLIVDMQFLPIFLPIYELTDVSRFYLTIVFV